MMMTLAQEITKFLFSLKFNTPLPTGIHVMNPYLEPQIREIVTRFYQTYYSDSNRRHIILAINPGRLGAGATGIPFTDTKRLNTVCGISSRIPETHEPSSVFVYDVIRAYGGPQAFYNDFLIGSVSPLGFLKENRQGNLVNFNYYDDKHVATLLTPFIRSELHRLLALNINRTTCICWGTGKNFSFLNKLNAEEGFFQHIIPLEHPRYIMQYKSKSKTRYIEKYLEVFASLANQSH